MKSPILKLDPKDARAVARGHPWVYRQALRGNVPKLKAGTQVRIAAQDKPPFGRGIFEPGASVAVRMWTDDPDERITPDLLARRIGAAVRLRDRAGVPERATAFRLVHAEGDRMPGVIVERYGDWLTLELQSTALRRWESRLVEALHATVTAHGIYVRSETDARLVAGEPCPAELIVREPAGRFVVDLDAPGKSGLFLDMREARVRIAPLLHGRRFLNLFAHTGAFSGVAAGAGATEVVSVDLGKRYLEVARRNVELNAASPGATTCPHEIVAEDVFETLKRFAQQGRRFDAVLVDPPTFSSSRRGGTFSVKDRYRPLVRAALRVLDPGGLLACATNWRGISREGFVRLLGDAARSEAVDLRVLEVFGQPADHPVLPAFPEGDYLQFAVCGTGERSEVR